MPLLPKNLLELASSIESDPTLSEIQWTYFQSQIIRCRFSKLLVSYSGLEPNAVCVRRQIVPSPELVIKFAEVFESFIPLYFRQSTELKPLYPTSSILTIKQDEYNDGK